MIALDWLLVTSAISSHNNQRHIVGHLLGHIYIRRVSLIHKQILL